MPTRLFDHRFVVAALAVGVLTACSGDDDATSTSPVPPTVSSPGVTAPAPTVAPPSVAASSTDATTAPPTTTAEAVTYEAAGPEPVGVTTLTLPSGVAVEVWYPAAAPITGTVGYDLRDYVPEAVRALLTADVAAGVTYPGQRDVEVAGGRHSLVLFSHGFSGVRVQSSLITSHLASYGMIVAAPEHASRDLTNVLAGTASGDATEAVADLLGALDLLVAEDATTGGRFEGRVDAERVGAVGHSAGGFTVVAAALDPRIDGYVSMASGGPRDGAPFPTVPSLFLAGATDAVVPAATATRPAFDAAPAPTWYVELAATGHNAFDDFCTFGNGTGIIGIAEASGLGPVLDAQPQLRSLGQDGCIPPAAPVDQALPIVRHTTTAFLRFVLGDDGPPVFGPELAGLGGVEVVTAAS